MGKRLSEEEKKARLQAMISFGQKGRYYTLADLKRAFNQDVSDSWTKTMYGMTLREYMLKEHALMTEEECIQYAYDTYSAIVNKYKEKPPIEITTIEEAFGADGFDVELLKRFWVDREDPERITLARRLSLDGVVKYPFETENEKRNLIQSVIDDTKEALRQSSSWNVTNCKFAFYSGYNGVRLVLPYSIFFENDKSKGKLLFYETVCEWISEIFHETPREFFERNGILCTRSELEPVFQRNLMQIKELYSRRRLAKDVDEVSSYLESIEDQAEDESNDEIIEMERNEPVSWMELYLLDDPALVGQEDKEKYVNEYLHKLFVSEGIIKAEGTEDNVYDDHVGQFFIYENMSRFDFSGFVAAAGNSKYPKNKEYTVMIDGKEFHVKTSWPKKKSEIGYCYDAYSAIDTMLSIAEVKQKVIEKDPNMHTDAFDLVSGPEFNFEKCIEIDEAEVDRRLGFITAVANLLDDQETIEAIVKATEKKKNGTLYKGRLFKIANSGVALGPQDLWSKVYGDGFRSIYAIVGKADSDFDLTITCRAVSCKPGDNEDWDHDFISIPHEGLRITDALKRITTVPPAETGDETGSVTNRNDGNMSSNSEEISFVQGNNVVLNNELILPVPDGYHYAIDGTNGNENWCYIVSESVPLIDNHVDAKPLCFAVTAKPIGQMPFESGKIDAFKSMFRTFGYLDANVFIDQVICSSHCAFLFQNWIDDKNELWNKIKGFLFANNNMYQFHIYANHESAVASEQPTILRFMKTGKEWMKNVRLENDAPIAEETASERAGKIGKDVEKICDVIDKAPAQLSVGTETKELIRRTYAAIGVMFYKKNGIEIDAGSVDLFYRMLGTISNRKVGKEVLLDAYTNSGAAGADIAGFVTNRINSIIASRLVTCDKAAGIEYKDGVAALHLEIIDHMLKMLCLKNDVDYGYNDFCLPCMSAAERVILEKWDSVNVIGPAAANKGNASSGQPKPETKPANKKTPRKTQHFYAETPVSENAAELSSIKQLYRIKDENGAITITGLKDKDLKEIVFPAKLNIVAIGNKAFASSMVEEAAIPDSVTGIGSDAFRDCTELKRITLGKNVESIGDTAFWNCSSLKEIVLNDNLKRIGERAFYNVDLDTLCLPKSLEEIGWYPFCLDKVKSISVDAKNKTFHSDNNCLIKTETKELYLGCSSGAIPDDGSVETIAPGAFFGCLGITDLVIPNGITSIGKMAFFDCANLRSVVLPSSLTQIGLNAFARCTGLTSITIPSSVKKLATDVFLNCNRLVVHTPAGSVADRYCRKCGLSVVNDIVEEKPASKPLSTSKKSAAKTAPDIDKQKSQETGSNSMPKGKPTKKPAAKPKRSAEDDAGLFKKYKGEEEVVVIPDGVTRIGSKAFAGNTSIKRVIAPDGLQYIGEGAFNGCTSLKEIVLPDTVEDIGRGAFKNCTALEEFTLPGNTINIWNNTFNGCSNLISLVVHKNLDFIYDIFSESAFLGVKKSALTVYAPKDSYAEEETKSFGALSGSTVVNHPPAGKGWPKCSLSEWDLKERREVKINEDLFVRYTGDKAVYVVPDTIKTIDTYAFRGNKSVKHVVLPNTIVAIKFGAFEGCEKLESMELPHGIKVINRDVFADCSSLRYVTVPDSVTRLDCWAFKGCANLRSLNIPSGVVFIDKDAIKLDYHDTPSLYKNLVIYGTPGTIAQKYAEAKQAQFKSGIPVGIPAPRTSDSPDPTIEAMKAYNANKAREKAAFEAKLRAEEEARLAEERRKEQERIAAEKRREAERLEAERRRREAEERRIAEENRVRSIREKIDELNAEIKRQETIVEENRGIFGDKARRRKEAKKRLEELKAEIERLKATI